jgi:hypothetical protein
VSDDVEETVDDTVPGLEANLFSRQLRMETPPSLRTRAHIADFDNQPMSESEIFSHSPHRQIRHPLNLLSEAKKRRKSA